jgi:hypothetical protein
VVTSYKIIKKSELENLKFEFKSEQESFSIGREKFEEKPMGSGFFKRAVMH